MFKTHTANWTSHLYPAMAPSSTLKSHTLQWPLVVLFTSVNKLYIFSFLCIGLQINVCMEKGACGYVI
jgi:hypothetical protein